MALPNNAAARPSVLTTPVARLGFALLNLPNRRKNDLAVEFRFVRIHPKHDFHRNRLILWSYFDASQGDTRFDARIPVANNGAR